MTTSPGRKARLPARTQLPALSLLPGYEAELCRQAASQAQTSSGQLVGPPERPWSSPRPAIWSQSRLLTCGWREHLAGGCRTCGVTHGAVGAASTSKRGAVGPPGGTHEAARAQELSIIIQPQDENMPGLAKLLETRDVHLGYFF